METIAFFEKKICVSPSQLNELKTISVEEILVRKAKEMVENKCSEQGFVLSGSVTLLSRSMGYFEAARFTGDTIYYVKLQGKVIYPVDGVRVVGNVIRKNKMGLYVNYQDAIRIQVPRDLHLGNREYDAVEVGMNVLVELKRSKFAINDTFILASGMFITTNTDMISNAPVEEEKEAAEQEAKHDEHEDEDEDEDEATDASETDTSEADASEADASEADASEADVSEADASEADASEADASEADVSEADASEAVAEDAVDNTV